MNKLVSLCFLTVLFCAGCGPSRAELESQLDTAWSRRSSIKYELNAARAISYREMKTNIALAHEKYPDDNDRMEKYRRELDASTDVYKRTNRLTDAIQKANGRIDELNEQLG